MTEAIRILTDYHNKILQETWKDEDGKRFVLTGIRLSIDRLKDEQFVQKVRATNAS